MKCTRFLALMSIVVSLGGCATGGDFCKVSAPIRPSKGDVLTDVTARQILTHDETGASLCGWRPR